MNEKPTRRPSKVISGSSRSKKSSLVWKKSLAPAGGATLRLYAGSMPIAGERASASESPLRTPISR